MAQETSVFLRIASALTSALDLNAARSDLAYDFTCALADGTGADQANQVFSDRRTLSSGATEDLDLNASLTNALGASVTFTKVKAIFIRNRGTTVLSIGGAASNQFINWVANSSDIVNIRPGGVFLLTAPDATGLAVTASTGDILKIANAAGASCDYDIIIVGVN